ncbi:methylated-DNA--[protein]-cysteine S-methyltransferase [Leptothrix ochracea]|uniref:methylated-DNA--[protein]-cysteine S-methyltransferase n=1 Tax=Leptothrix ochracea TaxID=735331 RepID=UPI0034E1CD10
MHSTTPPSLPLSCPLSFYARIATPLGWMTAVATDAGLTQLRFVDDLMGEKESAPTPSPMMDHPIDHPVLQAVAAGLAAYWQNPRAAAIGDRTAVALAPQGTPFQQRVWAEVARIPVGQTCSYRELAQRLGQVSAVRAVARALALNPMLVWVPCHRVIGSDGRLRGYAGGLERKQDLLHHEGAWPSLQ